MFEYFQGTLIEVRNFQIVLDVHNIGYILNVSAKTLAQVSGHIEEIVRLFAEHITTEFSESLYGFSTTEERTLFNLVRGVSRIGAKTALSVCSHLTYAEFSLLIQDNDTKTLSKIPGIGPKTAQRIVMELSGKFERTSPDTLQASQVLTDAISALTNLGYQKKNAKETVEYVIQERGFDITLDALITESLGKLIGG
jgi:holliday junction DNA helicase RuvA